MLVKKIFRNLFGTEGFQLHSLEPFILYQLRSKSWCVCVCVCYVRPMYSYSMCGMFYIGRDENHGTSKIPLVSICTDREERRALLVWLHDAFRAVCLSADPGNLRRLFTLKHLEGYQKSSRLIRTDITCLWITLHGTWYISIPNVTPADIQ